MFCAVERRRAPITSLRRAIIGPVVERAASDSSRVQENGAMKGETHRRRARRCKAFSVPSNFIFLRLTGEEGLLTALPCYLISASDLTNVPSSRFC